MQTATLKFARVSPQKARLVADQIRGLNVDKALALLQFSDKKSASILKKVLDSAVSNAENNASLDIDNLKVKSVMVDAGPVLKRMRARAKGRGSRILKRTSHISVTVSE